MQKLDFVKNLDTIVNRFQSDLIVEKFREGFKNPSANYNYEQLNPLLFLSKSQYDQIHRETEYNNILKSLNAESIYSVDNLARLTTFFKYGNGLNIISNVNAVSFYNFHQTLITTLKLSKELLLSDILNKGLEDSLLDGIIVFQVVIEGEGLETEKYIRILSALHELINIINETIRAEEEKSEIILLDSGSDTNIGIKTGVETANSILSLFKEVWGYFTAYRFQRAKLKDETLLNSLSIRAEILKKVSEGVITEEEAKQYIHIIKTRTNELIGMHVLPKQIVIDGAVVENKKLLSEIEDTKLITSGEHTNGFDGGI